MTDYLTPADLIANGLHLPALPRPPVELPAGTECAITGKPITHGYPVADMVSGATAEFLDCFRGGVDGYVSEAAARCFKKSNPREGNPTSRAFVIFEDGTAYLPLISVENAVKLGRPCWTHVVREVWPARQGQCVLIILTTDMKKRLWIRARIGQLGGRTPILYYDSETAGNEVLFVDWPRLLQVLELCEEVYEAGFPKRALRDSLYVTGKIVQTVGLQKARDWERRLQPWRGASEFIVATLIAQRQPKVVNPLEGERKEEDVQQQLFTTE